jgi:hypothetical protein
MPMTPNAKKYKDRMIRMVKRNLAVLESVNKAELTQDARVSMVQHRAVNEEILTALERCNTDLDLVIAYRNVMSVTADA